MLIQDIISQHDRGTLLNNSDETLAAIQLQIDDLARILERREKKILQAAGMIRSTTPEELREISQQIGTALINRYGCND